MNEFHFRPIFTWSYSFSIPSSLTTIYGVVNETDSTRSTDGENLFLLWFQLYLDPILKPFRVNTNVCCSLAFVVNAPCSDTHILIGSITTASCWGAHVCRMLRFLTSRSDRAKASWLLKGWVPTHTSCWKESEIRRKNLTLNWSRNVYTHCSTSLSTWCNYIDISFGMGTLARAEEINSVVFKFAIKRTGNKAESPPR